MKFLKQLDAHSHNYIISNVHLTYMASYPNKKTLGELSFKQVNFHFWNLGSEDCGWFDTSLHQKAESGVEILL